MKKFLLITLLLVYTGTVTYAYAPAHKKYASRRRKSSVENIKFGVGIGGSMCMIESTPMRVEIKKHPRFSLPAQAFGTYQLNQYVDVALAIGYHGKGDRFTLKDIDPSSNLRIETRRNFDYLQTTTQLCIFPGKDRQFFFAVGAYGGYLVAAKLYDDIYQNDQQQGESRTINLKEEDTENIFNKWDWGIAAGYGYAFEVGLILKIINNIGLSKLRDVEEYPGRNLAVNLILEYNFAKLLK